MKISQLNLSSISSPVIATFFSMLANGFLTTIVSIRLYEMGAGEWGVGVVSCGYYTGIVLGSFKCDSLINRIGHIRAYSAFASIAALTSLLCGILLDPYLWFILRLISGIAIAGIWISTESWLLAKSTSKVRGSICLFI
jgi:MFS family permease